jgi:hypothetical protein
VDHDWSSETRLEWHFVPSVLLAIVFIWRENLRSQFDLLFFTLVAGNSCLLFCSVLTLVLEIKTNRLLEINLNSSALILSL